MRTLRLLLLAVGAAFAVAATAAPLGPASLHTRHRELAAQLADSPFGEALVLRSVETKGSMEGDAFAVLDHGFPAVSAALSDPSRWCDLLILHLNTKHCQRVQEAGATRVEMRVGKKTEQPPASATLLSFAWNPPAVRPDYLLVTMAAPEGPYDTNDYTLMVEAVPLDSGHTFLHMGYTFGFGTASRLAMQLYLATVAHDKVGFTVLHPARANQETEYVAGMRGIVERNTMRYFLAIRCYLDSLALPAGQQVERRLAAWFDATERYRRQLHEVERDAYLTMKRHEVQRQAAGR